MSFKYKFESIRKIKEILEKKAQKEVALIEHQIENCRNEQRKLKENYENERRNIGLKIRAADLQSLQNFENFTQKEIEKLEFKIKELSVQKDKKHKELVKKTQEHKIFNSLKEKHYESYLLEQNKSEMVFMDELATQNFVRVKK